MLETWVLYVCRASLIVCRFFPEAPTSTHHQQIVSKPHGAHGCSFASVVTRAHMHTRAFLALRVPSGRASALVLAWGASRPSDTLDAPQPRQSMQQLDRAMMFVTLVPVGIGAWGLCPPHAAKLVPRDVSVSSAGE